MPARVYFILFIFSGLLVGFYFAFTDDKPTSIPDISTMEKPQKTLIKDTIFVKPVSSVLDFTDSIPNDLPFNNEMPNSAIMNQGEPDEEVLISNKVLIKDRSGQDNIFEVDENIDIEADLRMLGVAPSVPFSEAIDPVSFEDDLIPELLDGGEIDSVKTVSQLDMGSFEENDTVPERDITSNEFSSGESEGPEVSNSQDEMYLLKH